MTPDSLLAQYLSGPAQLQSAVAVLADAQLDRAPAAGAWTIRQIVHHIADGDTLWTLAVKAALGNTQAAFGFLWYWAMPQAEWAERWHYATRPIQPSLDLFAANRRHVESLLQHIPGAYERTLWIQWPENKEQITVRAIIEMQSRHALHH